MKTTLVGVALILLLTISTSGQKEGNVNQDFFEAVTKGNAERVKTMLASDRSLAKATDEKGVSAILKATYYGKKDVVAALLATEVELNIFEAAATGQTERLRALIKQDSSLVNSYNVDGFMPLGLAVFFGHPDTVEVLLANGAEVNAATRESMKVTPLNSAAAARQAKIAEILIAHGANVNAKAENDFTPLHEAAANGDIEFVTLLLEHGADIHAKTKDGKTPLAYAREHNRDDMVALLTKKGAEK